MEHDRRGSGRPDGAGTPPGAQPPGFQPPDGQRRGRFDGRDLHGGVSWQSEAARYRASQPARIQARRVRSAQRAAQRRQQARRDSFR
jgi:hypothetical protein